MERRDFGETVWPPRECGRPHSTGLQCTPIAAEQQSGRQAGQFVRNWGKQDAGDGDLDRAGSGRSRFRRATR